MLFVAVSPLVASILVLCVVISVLGVMFWMISVIVVLVKRCRCVAELQIFLT